MAERFAFPVLVTIALFVGVAVPAKKRPEPPSVVGVWVVDAITSEGRPLKAPPLAIEFTDDGKVFVGVGGPGEDRPIKSGTYTSRPAELELVLSPALPEPLPGIYKLDKDRLTVCVQNSPGKKRPTEFAAAEGSGCVLLTLKRKAKD